MSLDKLKLSWGSLDDSVDQKEIVVMKNLRKNSYILGYRGLSTYKNWDLAAIPLVLLVPLAYLFSEEFNVFVFVLYYGMCTILLVTFYLKLIKLKQIKMSDDISGLRRRFEDYLKYNKIYNRSGFIVVPILYVNVMWMIKGSTAILENPISSDIMIPLLFMICSFNAAMFYVINKFNKKHNRMLEDIKQLEELDMY